jgi:uncharacterized DUF497 family protein
MYKNCVIEFDSAKDEANIAKHGVSLSEAVNIDLRAVVADDRADYGEARFNGYGLLHGKTYCLTFTVRDGRVRAISLRRARAKEFKRHAL